MKIHAIFIWEIFRFSMAYGKDRESFLCEIKPIELQNSTCDFENTDFEDDLSSSSSIPPAESLIASKIAAIPKGDIVSVQILDEKFIFICKKRQESLLKSNFIHLSNDYKVALFDKLLTGTSLVYVNGRWTWKSRRHEDIEEIGNYSSSANDKSFYRSTSKLDNSKWSFDNFEFKTDLSSFHKFISNS